MRSLVGKVALVAGGTRGAGRGIAVELGAAGATVYVTGRTTQSQMAGEGLWLHGSRRIATGLLALYSRGSGRRKTGGCDLVPMSRPGVRVHAAPGDAVNA
jgi:NAD(P)-dependent dehydrogenase (short-subunit alcohol dehydrogenase family)